MTDDNTRYLQWRSFYLGLRVAIQVLEVPEAELNDRQSECLRLLGELAEGESTLQDPTANAVRFPESAEMFQRIGNINVQNDRELAEQVREGLNRATDTPE